MDDHPTVTDLDMAKLGQTLVALMVASEQMGHANPRTTAREYGASLTPETEFVRDMLTLDTRALMEKWADSELCLALQRELNERVAALIGAHRNR
jgi:hypothetical protein